VALQRDFTLNYQRGANRFLEEQSWAYLRGAEELAALALLLDTMRTYSARRRGMTSRSYGPRRRRPIHSTRAAGCIGSLVDLQGRFNLNSLAAQPG
jgi:general secretion pathway protein K